MKAWQVVLVVVGVLAGGVALIVLIGGAMVAVDAPGPDRFIVPGVTQAQIDAAKEYGVPVAIANDLGMRFVLIPAGETATASTDGTSPRAIRIEKPFYLQVTEVTNAQYKALEKDHDSGAYDTHKLSMDSHPVVRVTPTGAQTFATWLTREDPAHTYRLPTEAEWIHAFQCGQPLPVPPGVPLDAPEWAEENLVDQSAKEVFGETKPGDFEGKGYLESTDGHAISAPVGSFPPNTWKIHDLYGNVREICDDRAQKKITWGRMTRGASWADLPFDVSKTGWIGQGDRSKWLGFRLVVPLP